MEVLKNELHSLIDIKYFENQYPLRVYPAILEYTMLRVLEGDKTKLRAMMIAKDIVKTLFVDNT